MSTAKKLAWIAAGYALSIVGGFAAVAVNELFMPDDISQTSPGMVAFGDMILFMLSTGFFGLAPTWFLLKLFHEKAPRVLLAVLLLIAAIGPPSWLAIAHIATPNGANLPKVGRELFGLLIAFGAMPRIVAGPILLVIEAAAFFLFRERVTRALLAAAMLMDLVPLSMFALHMATAILR
jgi:hypothetical protein